MCYYLTMSINSELLLFDPRTKIETKATVLNTHELGFHTSEKIVRATAQFENKNVDTRLVIKTVNNLALNPEEEKMLPSDVWLEKREIVSQAGIPVVPEAWRISDRQVAMTDLEADGSVIYGKTHYRGTKRLDFLLPTIDVAKVETIANEYALFADRSKILLAFDDALVLLLNPKGHWNLLALDVGLTERLADARKNINISHLSNWNQQAAKGVVNLISNLQKK